MTSVNLRALRVAVLCALLLVPTAAALGLGGATLPTVPTPTHTGSDAAPTPATQANALDPLVGSAPAAPAAPDATPPLAPPVAVAMGDEYIVGFSTTFPVLTIKALGMEVAAVYPDAGFAIVKTARPDILQALAGPLGFNYVERNGITSLDSARWDSAQWDSARWDAAQWDSARWDSATWDSASWDSASWDSARWDAARWDSARWDASRWDGASADPGFGAEWHLGAIHALDAWNVTTAYHAITICVVDSGIDYTHPDISANMKRLSNGKFGYNFVANTNDPMDDGGHGTYMAGIAAATMGNGHGVAGVSQAYVTAAKVLGADGSGTEANLALGIRWCVDSGGAKIIMLALHTEGDNTGVHDAVKYAKSKGALLVAAAGNDGQVCDTCVAYPAAYNEALGIGALATDGTRAGFSNGGKEVSFMAPGVQIPGPFPGNKYVVGSGTSQATAIAAGAAALTWAAKPSMNADNVRDALTKSAKDAGAPGFDNEYGNGLLRLDRAFARMGLGGGDHNS